MAQLSFEQINSFSQKSNLSSQKIAYFNLKNNGDEALVRIMHDSVSDFDLLTVHPITLNGKFLKANCLREQATDSLGKCPLCAAGEKIQQRMFVRLIEYTMENGQIVATPKIWDRPMSYATELQSKMSMYGPLSEQLFIIKKHVPNTGNIQQDRLKTTYTTDYAPSQVYPYENYPKLTEAFTGYTALGNAVISRPAEDLQYYLINGSFPQKQQADNVAQVNTTPVVPNQVSYIPTVQPTFTAPTPVMDTVEQITNDFPTPWNDVPQMTPVGQPQQAAAQTQRPVRYY